MDKSQMSMALNSAGFMLSGVSVAHDPAEVMYGSIVRWVSCWKLERRDAINGRSVNEANLH